MRQCQLCNNTITGSGIKFCSSRCAVITSNKNRRTLKFCLLCKVQIPTHGTVQKYCSKLCAGIHSTILTIEKSELGIKQASSDTYRKYLIWKFGPKCVVCGWNEINPVSGNVPIQMNHIDGNAENTKLANLELLCPNHHSLTSTFGNLNKGNGRDSRGLRRNKMPK